MKPSNPQEPDDELTTIRKRLKKRLAEYRSDKAFVETQKTIVYRAKNGLSATLQAQSLILSVTAQIQRTAHFRVTSIVSHCLRAVFQEPYEFEVTFEKRKHATNAKLTFKRNKLTLPPKAVGGGVIDVAAFALRLACIVLARPTQRRFMVLDEPFRFVSHDHTDRLALLLTSLSKTMRFQFIIVTHSPDLRLGKTIYIGPQTAYQGE